MRNGRPVVIGENFLFHTANAKSIPFKVIFIPKDVYVRKIMSFNIFYCRINWS